jgi:hypothetical protein
VPPLPASASPRVRMSKGIACVVAGLVLAGLVAAGCVVATRSLKLDATGREPTVWKPPPGAVVGMLTLACAIAAVSVSNYLIFSTATNVVSVVRITSSMFIFIFFPLVCPRVYRH